MTPAVGPTVTVLQKLSWEASTMLSKQIHGACKYFNTLSTLLASERSERDTLRGNTIENQGCLFVYMFGRTYVILYFDPRVFLC